MSDMCDTTRYYEDNSMVFFEETVYADVTPLYERFLKYVPKDGKILDFGCGSGRDVKAFRERGFIAEGAVSNASYSLAKIAAITIGE